MISFAYPHLLWLLLLLPVIALLFWWARASRAAKLRRFGRPEVLAQLMPDASRYMPWVRLVLALFALAFLIIVIARPRATATLEESARETKESRGIEVMICLDVSNSMLASATDDPLATSRLDRAKHLLERLIKSLNDDIIGLIVFAGNAYTQLPITSDYISAKMFVNSVNTSMVPTQGTAIGAAIDMAMNAFSPDPKVGKAIIIITDGENFEDDAIEAAARAAAANIQVDVVGLGTAKGAPIVIDRAHNVYMKDYEGNQVVTALNEKEAQAIAEAGKGIYVSGNNSSAVNDLNEHLDQLAKSDFIRTTFSPQAEQFPIFAWLALIFMVLYALTVTRKISWLKRFTFFSKTDKK